MKRNNQGKCSPRGFFYFVFKSGYSCFPMLFHFLLYNEVNQTYVHIYPFLVELPPHTLCHHRAPGRAPWIAAGSPSCLFYMQPCPETTATLSVLCSSLSTLPPKVHTSILYILYISHPSLFQPWKQVHLHHIFFCLCKLFQHWLYLVFHSFCCLLHVQHFQVFSQECALSVFRIPVEMNLCHIKTPLYIELSFNVTVCIFPLKPSLLYSFCEI